MSYSVRCAHVREVSNEQELQCYLGPTEEESLSMEKETIELPLEVKLEELAQVPIGSDASIDISEKINLVERILNFTPTPLPLRS